MLEKLNSTEQKENVSTGKKPEPENRKSEDENVVGEVKKSVDNPKPLFDLLHPEKQDNYLPSQFRKRKEKSNRRDFVKKVLI